MGSRIVGLREIATLLSLSRQRADQLVRTDGFPTPVAELARGRVWERSAVVRWAKATGRSVPWATIELELEHVPKGSRGSAANYYRTVWVMTRHAQLRKNQRDDIPLSRAFAHAQALAAARHADPSFELQVPPEVDDEE